MANSIPGGYFGTASLQDPYNDAAAVTPSDSTPLGQVTRALYIGGAGNVTLITYAGNTVAFESVPVGTVIQIRTSQVKATGTTATNILALY